MGILFPHCLFVDFKLLSLATTASTRYVMNSLNIFLFLCWQCNEKLNTTIQRISDIYNVKCNKYFSSVESCQTDVCEVKRDMIAIKHEIDSVQLVKDEIDDIRESLDRLEAESQRRKNKLLEQVKILTFLSVL